MLNLGSVLNHSRPFPVGSKSDGQKSPSDSVFLRMDEIPYMRTECLEEKGRTGGWNYHHFILYKHDIILFFPIYVIACGTPWKKRKASKSIRKQNVSNNLNKYSTSSWFPPKSHPLIICLISNTWRFAQEVYLSIFTSKRTRQVQISLCPGDQQYLFLLSFTNL